MRKYAKAVSFTELQAKLLTVDLRTSGLLKCRALSENIAWTEIQPSRLSFLGAAAF